MRMQKKNLFFNFSVLLRGILTTADTRVLVYDSCFS